MARGCKGRPSATGAGLGADAARRDRALGPALHAVHQDFLSGGCSRAKKER